MEEDDQNAPPSTPFWLQSRRNNTYFNRTASLRSRATTVATQVFLTAVASILIVFFILPPFFSSVSQIFRPHLVRKSWDYLNFVLVLFAVICGFLSRNSGGDDSNRNNREEKKATSSYESSYDRFSKLPSLDRGRVSNGATPRYWVDDQFSDQTYKRFGRLRSSSSHPDLRLREFEDEEQWRFYDDTHLSGCRYDGPDRIYQSSSTWQEIKPAQDSDPIGEGSKPQVTKNGHIGEPDSEKVEVITTATEKTTAEVEEVKESSPLPPNPTSAPRSPPHDPPPAKSAKRKTKRVYQDLPSKEEKEIADLPVTTPLTPIPPPAVVYRKSTKQEKKKGGATKDFLIALRRKKKKKQRQQSIDGLDLLFGSDPISQPLKSPPHPPPPPPPPFFQGLFSSKKGKSKRTNSTPPPPPPLPPQRHLQSRASISNTGKPPVESRTSKPIPPAKVTAFNKRDEIINTGNESPLMAIPKPPPPPPFKMPEWKFVKRGDYVRMASDISISSDDPDDSDGAQTADGKATGTTNVNLFCPSPDVDTKANNFIARFRAGLKLEKMNSDKRGRSNLGPESEHGPYEFGS